MAKKALYLFFITAITSLSTYSQNYVDIAKLNYGHVPNVPIGDAGNSTDVHDIDAGLVYPIKLNEKTALITGVDFSDQNLKVTGLGKTLNLYSVGIRFGASIQHSEKWSGLYVAIPKMAGDFGKVSSKDFQIGGVALWKYSKSENFKYKIGMYASTEAFGVITIPIVGGYYLSPNKKFEANVSLPLAVDLNYKIVKPVRLGLDFNAIVRSYDLSQDYLSSFYLHRWVKELGAYLQFDFFKESLILKTKVVYAMNDFALFDDGDEITLAVPATEIGDNRIRRNTHFGNVLGAKVTLMYRFQLNKEKADE